MVRLIRLAAMAAALTLATAAQAQITKDTVKIGVLAGSLISAAAGYMLLRTVGKSSEIP